MSFGHGLKRVGGVAIVMMVLCLAREGSSFKRDYDPMGSFDVKEMSGKGGTSRPLIGILSQEGAPAPEGFSYIAASYVKFVEAGGARAVPILVDDDEETLRAKFEAVNGLLIPGGGAGLEKGDNFHDQASKILKWAMESFDSGEPFPIHGTCLGFQLLSILINDDDPNTLHKDMDSANLPSKLIFTEEAYNKESGIMTVFDSDFIEVLSEKTISYENHHHGVLTTTFKNSTSLVNFFDVLATANDRQGLNYIAMMESKKYPITATQFHPEKNAFEWVTTEDINHSGYGVKLMQTIANFLISEARASSHKPLDFKQEQDFLIYNYAPTFTGKAINPINSTQVESSFDQSYMFPLKRDM